MGGFSSFQSLRKDHWPESKQSQPGKVVVNIGQNLSTPVSACILVAEECYLVVSNRQPYEKKYTYNCYVTKQTTREQKAPLNLPESESAETIQDSIHGPDAVLVLPVVFLLRQRGGR